VNIAILSCKNIKDESCFGCHRCLLGMDKQEGEFERYKDNPDAKLRAILHCGGCPGMAPMGETIDKIHIGTCLIKYCPYKDSILQKVKEKAGIEVIEGTHYYAPPTILGASLKRFESLPVPQPRLQPPRGGDRWSTFADEGWR
jgi:predicted metal-binding protein